MDKFTSNSTGNSDSAPGAGSLWARLKIDAGLDIIYYDKDVVDELYEQLAISERGRSFVEDLIKYKISQESLIVSLLSQIQPYTEMMSDLCVFFERNKVVGTDESLRIEFDFDTPGLKELSFGIDNFRETVIEYRRVRSAFRGFSFTAEDLWQINKLFVTQPFDAHKSKDDDRRRQLMENESIPLIDELHFPVFGDSNLDNRMAQLFSVLESYIRACYSVDSDRIRLVGKLYGMRKSIEFEQNAILGTWPVLTLLGTVHDRWPGCLINNVYRKFEELSQKGDKERKAMVLSLADELGSILDRCIQYRKDLDNAIFEAVSFLNLPIWKYRYELYSAWMLTNIDKAAADYRRCVKHENGILKMPFKPTHLMTVFLLDEDFQIWSEFRSPASRPIGKGRSGNIQPDYTIFKGSPVPENAVAAIEVKQYRRSKRTNFEAAIYDYSMGLPNAWIYLVNYGKNSGSIKLPFEDRNDIFGLVRPGSDTQTQFIQRLKYRFLPSQIERFSDQAVEPLEPEWKKGNFYVFVDLAALNVSSVEYNDFFIPLMRGLFRKKRRVYKMYAIGESIRGRWTEPDMGSVDALCQLLPENRSDFSRFIPEISGVTRLVVTDSHGWKYLTSFGISPYLLLCLDGDKSSLRIMGEGKCLQSLDVTWSELRQAAFQGPASE